MTEGNFTGTALSQAPLATETGENVALEISGSTFMQPDSPDANVSGPVAFKPILGLKKWEGQVTEIGEDSFTANLTRVDAFEPDVEAEFSLERLSSLEASDLEVGAIIYVTVRGVGTPSGSKTYTSAIRVRRLGRWTEEEVKEIRSLARSDSESAKSLSD